MGKFQELREQAKKLEIPGYGSMKTAELEAAIAAADKPDGGGAETTFKPNKTVTPIDVMVDKTTELLLHGGDPNEPGSAPDAPKRLKVVFVPEKNIFAAIAPDPSWTPDKEAHIFFSKECGFPQGGHGYRRELRVFKNALQMAGFTVVEY